MNTTCKNYEKCPIYSGVLTGKESTSKGYRNQFYDAGEKGWTRCKRYQVKERTGMCPPDLLPNSFKDLDTIIKEMTSK